LLQPHHWYNAINISFPYHPGSPRKAPDMNEIAEDIAGFFHNTWVKMDETNERVTIIEDHLDMPHLKEN